MGFQNGPTWVVSGVTQMNEHEAVALNGEFRADAEVATVAERG